MKQPLLILLFLIQIFSVGNGFSQNLTNEGTDFWYSYTERWNNSGDATYEAHLTSRSNAAGTIYAGGISFPFTVVPGQVTVVLLPATLHNTSNNSVTTNAVHVVSNNPISVFAPTMHMHLSEASIILPSSALGSEYYISSKPHSTVAAYYANFNIVGAVDSCTVDITPSVSIAGICTAGIPFTISLDSGEVYQLATDSTSKDFSGTHIKASNGTDIFAVFSGHFAMNLFGTPYDPLYEEEYPVSSWGKEYIVTPLNDITYTGFQVVAQEATTDVFVNGVQVATIGAGQIYEDTTINVAVITGSKPIKVMHYMPAASESTPPGYGSGYGDASMACITPNEQMLIDTITFSQQLGYNMNHNFVNIVTRSVDTSLLALNGIPISNWIIVQSLSDYSYKIMATDSGAHTLTTTGCGFAAYAYGLGYAASYYYSAGAVLNVLDDSINISNVTTGSNTYCINDSVNFQASATGNVLNYLWDFGDATTSTQSTPTHAYSAANTYPVSVILTYNCFSDTLLDTVEVITCCTNDSLGFSYTFPDPCDSSIVEFTANSTGAMDSIWWGMGFPGGSGSIDTTTTTNFLNVQSYNINLWVYGACGWKDTTITFLVLSEQTDHYELNNSDINYCLGDAIANLTLTDTSATSSGGTITWYSDAGLTTSLGTGLSLTPGSALGNYSYYIVETLACGDRIIDSVFINIDDCYCPNNLVPNPGFESYTSCPTGAIPSANIVLATPWDNPPPNPNQSSADVANNCAPPTTTTVPHSGNGYAHIAGYEDGSEYREYLQAPLNATLEAGKCYHASMFVTMAVSSYASIDSMGMYFSNGAPMQGVPGGTYLSGQGLISVTPQVVNDPSVDLTSQSWQHITGTFIATGNEDYITVGNFTPNANLTVVQLEPFPNYTAKYLFDDICLYEVPNDTVNQDLIADTTDCSNITLTGSASYNQYNWYNSGGVLVSTNQSFTASVSDSYVLYSSDSTICPRTYYRDTVGVVISSAIPNTLVNDSICPADSIFLQGAYQDTAGVYYDTLTTTSGCDSIVETTLAISAGAVANFVNPADTICLSTGIIFLTSHPSNVYPDVKYSFNWGDGTSTGPISAPYNLLGPHYYSTAGTYIVQLIANNPSGTCPPDTAYHTLVVTSGPTPIISTASATPCFGITTDLIDASIPNGSPIVSWQWIINEIDTLTTQNPSYTFGFAGDQYIELTVTDANGCSATLTDTVEIHGNPNLVDFTFSSPLCLCSQVDFTASGTATTLAWDYGDGNTGSGSTNTNNYSYPGAYSVVLTGTDASGCTYSRSHVVDVCPNDTLYEVSRSNNNWFFGRDQGIAFSTGSPVNQPGGQITGLSIEGSSTMSHHRTGDLLFYSDAKSVWDANHNVMPNGTGFISSSNGQSTAQATLIVPMPGDSNQYYIFMNNGRSQDISLNETRFSVVDMNLNGGSGDIVTASKNTWMLTHSGGEAMSGTTKERATCSAEAEYWVAVADSNKIFLFLVDIGGVSLFSTTIIDPSGITPGFKKILTSAFSRSGGKYIVKVNSVFGTAYHYSYVFDFNRITGVFSNPFRLTTQGTYASAFSPDETILYVSSHHPTTPAGIYQYDLNAASISASKIQLGTTQASSMWTGDDGKIYHVSPVVGTPYLGAINNPDVVGSGCNYVDDQVALTGSIASHNLQNIIKLELPLILDSMEVAFTADTTNCLEVSFSNLTDTVLYDTCSFFAQGGGATYLWDFGDGTTSTAFEPFHTYANGGVFNVQLIVEIQSMCLIDSITIPITVYPCASILVSDTSICEGDSVLLVASGSAAGYTWADSLAIGMALLTPDSSYLVSPTITTTYAVYNGTDTAYATVTVYNSGSVTNILSECAGFTTTVNGNVYSSTGVYVDTLFGANAEGCDSIITTDLTILPAPIVTLTGDTSICIGDPAVLISTNGAVIWNTGDTSATISVSPIISGWYSATLSNSCGSSTDSIYVAINQLPVASAGNDTIVMPLDDFTLNASGGIFYSWSPTTGLSCDNCPNPTASIEANTVYCVAVTDSNGCRSNDCVSITIDASGEVWAPNIFSPNGDALNDVFYIRGPIQSDDFVLMIFNRWGEKVFETSDPAQGWDGTQNGKELNTAVFVYTASGTTWGGTEFTLQGNITRFAK